MACFIVPGTEAVVMTAVKKAVGKEKAEQLKLGWLSTMLWGGTVLLAVEHVWHGEVAPWPPFLTAMKNSADVAPMLHEMATTGVMMAVAVTLTWAIMVVVSAAMAKRDLAAPKKAKV